MIIENEDALKEWLGKRLEPICDADPHALSKYVTALLRKDKSKDDLHSICVDQLEVFLQGETVQFVNDLFKQLDSKDYLRPKSERVEKKPVSRSPSPRKRRSVSRSPEKRRDYTPERRKRRERSPSPRRRSRSPRERKMKKERSRSREKKHKRDRHRTASEEEERRAHKKAKKQKKSKDREESPLGNITRTINVTKSKECPEYAETGICKQGNCTLEHSGALVTIENESTPKKESTPAANGIESFFQNATLFFTNCNFLSIFHSRFSDTAANWRNTTQLSRVSESRSFIRPIYARHWSPADASPTTRCI